MRWRLAEMFYLRTVIPARRDRRGFRSPHCAQPGKTSVMLPSLTLRVPMALNGTPRVREGSTKRVFEYSHRLAAAGMDPDRSTEGHS
jgi:hypothetical protein